MDVRSWSVCVIEANKFEGQLILDILRNAGVEKVKVFTDSEAAMDALEVTNANIIIGCLEATPLEGVAWTRAFRRNAKVMNRKAAVFLTSRAFSRSIAEDCRHGGANALIGKPLSAKVLLATINKVLGAPRQFIDAAGYVGPCRRAGIVTAGAPKKRRKADESAAAADEAATLAQAFTSLTAALTQMASGLGGAAQCEAALRRVQAYAVNANDKPLMSVCGTLAQQLTMHDLRSDAGKAALNVCAAGIGQLAELGLNQTAQRESVAAGVRLTISKVVAAAKAA
jgi:DNA-binding response OmpR family regulator